MFNKKESASDDNTSSNFNKSSKETSSANQSYEYSSASAKNVAVIGPSIQIEGNLIGEENLVIEGEVKGTVQLKNNSVTIGEKGKVTAEVCAHSITVKGFLDGDLYGAEQIRICNTARLRGNIVSPRVSLEDGAKFKGSIEMDPESEALKSAFKDKFNSTKTHSTSGASKFESSTKDDKKEMNTDSSIDNKKQQDRSINSAQAS